MRDRILLPLNQWRAEFARCSEGSIVPAFAILAIPFMAMVGMGIDYSRASSVRSQLQASLDSAVLAGAKDASQNWTQIAQAEFDGNPARLTGGADAPSFTTDANGNYSGSVTASVPTMFMGVFAISSMPVSASSLVAPPSGVDNSCILSLDHGQPLSHQSMTFNGAPNVALTGCGLRSNTSMTCNGHSGGATASIGAGSVGGCSNPQSNATVVPDIYTTLASSISSKCSGQGAGVTWNVGVSTPPAGLVTVTQSNYTEYHVCGNLTLTGTGYLTGSAPTTDTVIVIENGDLILADDASVTAMRVTLVLTGNNQYASQVEFPNGNGHAASLSLSPSTSANNPWQGVSLYQNPSLTSTVDNTWGPAATFNADGVVYLPNSNVTMHGSGTSNNAKCTKLVVNSFTSDGSMDINFSQTASGCTTLGVKQWSASPIHLAR